MTTINKLELARLKNTPIYSRKTINNILRTKYFTKNVYSEKPYTFDDLINCFWSICRENKTLVFEEHVEKVDNEVYAIYPSSDKLVWCSILHNFGNLCFAQTNLSVDVVLEMLAIDGLKVVCAEYNLDANVVQKVSLLYGEKSVVEKQCPFKDLLGTMSDSKLAQKVGCSRENIRLWRIKYNIPAYKKVDTWNDEEIDLLGKLSDKQVAEITGRKVHEIYCKRQELNIPARRGLRKWTDEEIQLLGTMSDDDVAKMLNVSKNTVFLKRRKLGIKPYAKYNRYNPVMDWTPEHDALFQTMRVVDVARKLNVPYHIAHGRKKKLTTYR